ncbi:hypothetical protein CB1_001907081 [Camelus ferus]|nr:hypothetical protein CB1_001907081 [Camelus ferus]
MVLRLHLRADKACWERLGGLRTSQSRDSLQGQSGVCDPSYIFMTPRTQAAAQPSTSDIRRLDSIASWSNYSLFTNYEPKVALAHYLASMAPTATCFLNLALQDDG